MNERNDVIAEMREHLTPLGQEFWEKGRAESCPIYDFHGHSGPFTWIYMPRHQPAAMLRSMDAAGVKILFFCPHVLLFSGEMDQSEAIDTVRAYPERFRAYAGVNPHFPAAMQQLLTRFDALKDVFVGFKFHPDVHEVALMDERYQPVLEYANAHRLLLLSHTWGNSPYDGPAQVRALAEKYPDLICLLGHSCHGDWEAAVHLARDFPNLYLDLTAVFDNRPVLEKFVNAAGSEKMLFGTDLPWFDPHHAIGCLLSAEITDADRHNICHRNAERILRRLQDYW